jgi:hypothetical protein
MYSFCDLSCNRNAQSGTIKTARFKQYDKGAVLYLAPGSGDLEKFRPLKDSIFLFKGKAHRDSSPITRFTVRVDLAGKSSSASGPATINYSATRLGRHPFAKSMISGPFDFAGLKCAFHFPTSLYYYKYLILGWRQQSLCVARACKTLNL